MVSQIPSTNEIKYLESMQMTDKKHYVNYALNTHDWWIEAAKNRGLSGGKALCSRLCRGAGSRLDPVGGVAGFEWPGLYPPLQ